MIRNASLCIGVLLFLVFGVGAHAVADDPNWIELDANLGNLTDWETNTSTGGPAGGYAEIASGESFASVAATESGYGNYHFHLHNLVPAYTRASTSAWEGGRLVSPSLLEPHEIAASLDVSWSETGNSSGSPEGSWWKFYWVSNMEDPLGVPFCTMQILEDYSVDIDRPGTDDDEFYYLDSDDSFTEVCSPAAAGYENDGYIVVEYEVYHAAGLWHTQSNSFLVGYAKMNWHVSYPTSIGDPDE